MKAGTDRRGESKKGRIRWETSEKGGKKGEKMSLQYRDLEFRAIITALLLPVVHLGKSNPATANFNSSLLKRLSASWLAERKGREERAGTRGRVLVLQHYCFLSSPNSYFSNECVLFSDR